MNTRLLAWVPCVAAPVVLLVQCKQVEDALDHVSLAELEVRAEKVDPTAATFTPLPAPPGKCLPAYALSIDHKIFLTSGINEQMKVAPDLESCAPSANRWTVLAGSPNPRLSTAEQPERRRSPHVLRTGLSVHLANPSARWSGGLVDACARNGVARKARLLDPQTHHALCLHARSTSQASVCLRSESMQWGDRSTHSGNLCDVRAL